jgi:hypothetical protein
MATVIPAMIAGGAQYFGKNIPGIHDINVPPTSPVQAGPGGQAFNASPESYQLDKPFIDNLLRQERARISGEN